MFVPLESHRGLFQGSTLSLEQCSGHSTVSFNFIRGTFLVGIAALALAYDHVLVAYYL